MFHRTDFARVDTKRKSWVLFLLLGLILLAIIVATNVTMVHAGANKMVINTYYGDSEMTNQVGTQIVLRCGGTSGPIWGEPGNYVEQEETTCTDYRTITYGCHYGLILTDSQGKPYVKIQFEITCPDHIRRY